MAKVTSKYQVTIPKTLAKRFGLDPGDEIEWSASGESIRLTPLRNQTETLSVDDRLDLFDRATARQARRQRVPRTARGERQDSRGWRRDELYDRGRTR